MKKATAAGLLAIVASLAQPVLAQINIGVTVSATGPAASLGIPEKNTISLLPTTMGGQKVNYIVLDDATNPTEANKMPSGSLASIRSMPLLGQPPRRPH